MTTGELNVDNSNDEAIAAWDGPLFERWIQMVDITLPYMQAYSDRALELSPVRPGERVLDIGCGLGDTTGRIAGLVGADGRALGIDAAARMLDVAREREGATGAEFRTHDMQMPLDDGPFDAAFARFGTMFFANPVWALRNVHAILEPGGRLTMIVWRRREDNDFIYIAQQVVESIMSRPEEYEEPTCGPGPFSMAGADTVSDQVLAAGFADVALHRLDRPLRIGRTMDEAIAANMAIGPGAEILRLWGDRMAHKHDEVRDKLRAALAPLETDEGIVGRSSVWVVTARKPG